MNSEELGKKIEGLIHEYVEAGQREAQAAMARAFASKTGTSRRSGSTKRKRKQGDRRTPEQVADLCEKLYAAIREKPGEKMVVFAADVGATVRELHRPMTLLRREGRIRSMGQRQHTKYYPSAGA